MTVKRWGSGLAAALCLSAATGALAAAADGPRILQQPVISRELVAFGHGGDIWTAPRGGGRAVRLTSGVGIESGPVFSPDGRTIAFTGEYDGNTDVFTVPASGGTPRRITFHPGVDVAVGWSRDGRSILFRSNRVAASRYAQLFTVPAEGGVPTVAPLPMAFAGEYAPDGRAIAYTPLAPAFSFDFTSYTSWGNYKGGRAGAIWVTSLPGLDSVQVPHEEAADFSPTYAGGKIYFLSARRGPAGVFSYDPATRAVAEVFHNTGPDIRSLSSDGRTLIFDRLGELWTLEPGGQPQRLNVDVVGDMPDVRPRILNVADQVETVAISPTGLRAVVEAHGEILTAPAKRGPMRNVTNTPGAMEREPAWSPDGQSIAYFSDADGLYALHIAGQTGARNTGAAPVRRIALSAEPAYYFKPVWSPDSRKVAFYDNRLNTWVADLATGRAAKVGEPDAFGGFSSESHGMAWSPDSRWLAFTRTMPNHLHALWLYGTLDGRATQITDGLGEATDPAFDRNGKYLYYLGSNNAGATTYGLDMSTDLYAVTSSIYAVSLTADTPSPVAPEEYDEKNAAEAREKAKDASDDTPAGRQGEAAAEAKARPRAAPPPTAAPATTRIDLAGLSPEAIAVRTAALPLPPRAYEGLATGKPGVLYVVERPSSQSRFGDGGGGVLSRWKLEDRKLEKLAERVEAFSVSADGSKLLVAQSAMRSPEMAAPGGPGPKPTYVIAPSDAPLKPGEGALSLDGLEVRVDPSAEWAQMYREVWRIQRAYFYDPAFHGYDTVAGEKAYQPYVAALQSRSDLNYVFQEMLTGFSVGHLRGSGGAIPSARKVPGGLLGADYVVQGGRYCIAKVYTAGAFTPDVKAPLAQPGMNVKAGDCILAINGQAVDGGRDISEMLEGTAGQAIVLRLARAGAPTRDLSVVPIASEARLRNLDWIEGNRRRVDQLSGGKLAYVYLPDTGAGGFTSFNRYYFAQLDKSGAVVDERFNGGGQVADYIIETLKRGLQSYWSGRYGGIERSPNAAIYGPKVMIANEVSGSGGDMLPWLFKHERIGPLVGKRTWGGLVGIGPIPTLMDGGQVTSPSVGFFSPAGEWDVENHGVAPDYVVEQDPKAVAAGHDPQLEAAVALAMDALKKTPPPAPRRPAFPNYRRTRGD